LKNIFKRDLTYPDNLSYYRNMDESARPNEEEKLLEAPAEESLISPPDEEKLLPAHSSANHKRTLLMILLGGIGLLIILSLAYFAYILLAPEDTTMSIPHPLESGYTNSSETDGDDPQVACTMEAKLCPDGSSVGRTGPNCEFAACPGE
jgi:hypothetical protein